MLLPDSTVLQKQPPAHYLLSWSTAVDVCKQHLTRSLAKGHQPRHPLCPKGNFWSSHVRIPTIELTSFHASFYKLISECSVTRLQSDSDCPRIATCCRALVTSIRSPFSDSHDCTIAWGSSAFFLSFFFLLIWVHSSWVESLQLLAGNLSTVTQNSRSVLILGLLNDSAF